MTKTDTISKLKEISSMMTNEFKEVIDSAIVYLNSEDLFSKYAKILSSMTKIPHDEIIGGTTSNGKNLRNLVIYVMSINGIDESTIIMQTGLKKVGVYDALINAKTPYNMSIIHEFERRTRL